MESKDTLIERFYQAKKLIMESLDNTRKTIIDLVNSRGGYINTANNDGEQENIYSAVFDYCGAGELNEVIIKAVKVVNDTLYVYVVPITNLKLEYYDEDMIKDEDNWYVVDLSSDLHYAYTILSLVDVFEYGEYI